jgi:hypothetical protein
VRHPCGGVKRLVAPPTPPPSFRTEQADFFFRIRSCECVGLRSEKSLFLLSFFDLHFLPLATHHSPLFFLHSAATAGGNESMCFKNVTAVQIFSSETSFPDASLPKLPSHQNIPEYRTPPLMIQNN